LEQTLSLDGHPVETASDGSIALEKLQECAYGLILSDLRMPLLDGPELYWELVRHHPRLQRRIIFPTGDTLGFETLTLSGADPGAVPAKPFRLEELRQVVQRTPQEPSVPV
jgi:CheY-like chemotaxis protein